MRSKILRLYVVSILLGILVGLVGSSFRISIESFISVLEHFYQFLELHGWPAALVSGLISMLLVTTAFLAVRHFAPEAAGSGIPEVEGALLHRQPLLWRTLLPVKFIFGFFSLSAKMVLGREGPTIHIGGALGEMLGSLFALTRRRRDSLIAAGAAAGLAVAFNAPLAGVIFVMEEMRNQFNYSFTNFTMVVISCIIATLVMDLMIGSTATIQMTVFDLPTLNSLWLFVLFGIIVGGAGLLFNKALMSALAWSDQRSFPEKLCFVLVIGFLVGVLAVQYPLLADGGMQIIHPELTLTPSLKALILIFIIRFILSIACYATGVPGGIFAPMLALGTVLGLAVFHLLTWVNLSYLTQPGMFAVAGMAAFFAAVTRAPITASILVVEMTQNYSLIFPIMMSCLGATIVMQLAANESIYVQLLDRNSRKIRMYNS